jgi:hypothetical protein
MSTTPTDTEPVNLRGILLGDRGPDDADLLGRIEQALAATAAKVPGWLLEEAAVALGEVGADLLDLGLPDVLLTALAHYRELRDAGERTLEDPTSEELVDLAAHDVTLEQKHETDILVNGAPLDRVQFAMTATLTIKALRAKVRDGRLVGLRSGDFELQACLSLQDRPLVSHEGELRLPLETQLRPGIALTTSPETIDLTEQPARTR